MAQQDQIKVISMTCSNKKCPLPNAEFLQRADSKNKYCSFCRWKIEKKLVKFQGREPKALA